MIVDHYVLAKVLHRIKKIIGIEEFDNTNIFLDTDNILSENITLKNAVILILITSVIKDDGTFYPQLLLKEALYDE